MSSPVRLGGQLEAALGGDVVDRDRGGVGCDAASQIELPASHRHERRSGGRLWICYRKGRKGFSRNDIGAAVDATGLDLTWFRQTSIDATWSAIWFKHRSEFKTLNH